ncbi:dynein heavy chain 5, axonemal [Trichonephila clavata]|uniref:Dynein heavy chain 5, axonemal n=1 Tax=Trichonephila clavata TaxID=2740835 RepID=A0A8X6JE81_TRICU|nr:dynein heavy chain 5, axonemal [Trichonephila clavata]
MNFEGRWPFKSNGVSWGAVHNLSKAKGKFLNVGDHYLKTLKKKSKNYATETPHVDSRYDYMLSLVSLASGLSKDDLSEENAQEKKVDLANSFFTDTKLRRLLFLSADSILGAVSRTTSNAVVLHTDESFILKGLSSFFIKEVSNEPLPQNVINSSVLFYSINGSPSFVFGSLYQTCKFVYLPRLRKVWCDNSSDFESSLPAAYDNLLYSLEALGDALLVAHLGITRGLTLRRSSVALAEATAAQDSMPSQETTREAENLINVWKDQIEQLLTESSYLRKESELHGPRTELEYWKCRRDSFGFLVHQFQQEQNKMILQRPLASSPELEATWMALDNRVRSSWREAKECTAFLECLERYCQPLYSCNPETISKSLPGLIRTLFTINTVSLYYNSTERMTAVLTKITNQMINSCKRYLSCNGTKSVWEQPEDVVKRKISACIELNEEYQICFQRVKDETEVPQTREFHFCEVFVFGKFDAFCNRLKKLLKLFDCVQIHDNIISYQQEVLDELPYSLEDSINKMKSKDYDFLDHKDLHFDEDFAEVMKVFEEIQKSITTAFDEEFAAIKSTILSLKFLEKLALLHLPGANMNEKYFQVLREYKRELEDIGQLFKKQKQDPPLPRNYPPVAGKINWCKQLRHRIEDPLKILKERCGVLDSDLGKKVQQKYKRFHSMLVKYETEAHRHWFQEASMMGQCLLISLIEEDLDTREMVLNTNEQLFVLIRETDIMTQMGLEVPPVAKTAFYQQKKLKQHKSCLEHYNCIKMVNITRSILFHGLCESITHIESLFDRLCKILNHRVDETLAQVADVELCPLTPDNPVTIQAFSSILSTSAAEGADFLEKRSHAVEDAVQEVIEVFVKESAFNEEEEKSKQQKRKITDVSVGLQQQCSKKLLESVITSICDSLEALLYSTSYNEKATPEENLMKNPWFKAEVHLKDKKLVMEPSIDDIQEMINKAAMDIISSSRQIIQWQYKEPGRDDDKSNKEGGLYKSQSKSDCSTVGLTLYRQVSEDKEVLQLYGSIQTCMKNTKLELDNYLELFLKYEHLWGKARNDEIQAFASEKRELIDFEDKIKYYLQVRTEIEMETNETTLGCIRLSLSPVNKWLKAETWKWCEAFGGACRMKYKAEMQRCSQEVKGFMQRLNQPFSTTEEIKALISVLEEIREKEVDIDSAITPVEECFTTLAIYKLVPNKEDLDNIENLRYLWEQTQKQSTETQNSLLDMKTQFQAQLSENISSFTNEFEKFQKDYQEKGPLVVGLSAMEASNRLAEYQNRFDGLWQKYMTYTDGAILFGYKCKEFPRLHYIRKELGMMQKLYKLYNDVLDKVNGYQDILWNNVDIDKITNELIEFQNRCRKLPKGLKEWPAFTQLKKMIDDFNELCPLLDLMTNKAMKGRHWKRLIELTGQEFDVTCPHFCLKDILKAPLLNHKEDIEDICISALKERDIEGKLKQVTSEWSNQNLTFAAFKNRGELLLRGDTTAEIISLLEDSLMILGSLQSNRYNAPFKSQIQKWVQDLSNTNECLERWLFTQNMWVYLEAVFVGGDIAKQLPKVKKAFI